MIRNDVLMKIEGSLREHSSVSDAVVMTADAHAAKLVVAFVTCREAISIAELRRCAEAGFPDQGLSSFHLVVIDGSAGQDGEADVAGLERLLEEEVLRADRYVAPVTDTERRLAAVWQDLLLVDNVSAFEDFWMLGGTSLKASELQLEIFRQFDVGLALKVILESENLRTLARAIDEAAGSDFDIRL